MKKCIIVFLSIIMMLGLCACGNKTDAKVTPQINQMFTVSTQIMYNDNEYQAIVKRLGDANWDIEFSSPNTIAGVLLSYRDNNVEASYKGLSFSVPKSALPVKAIMTTLIDVVDSQAKNSEIAGEVKDGILNVEGETEIGKYVLKLDSEGKLAGFNMSGLNLEMTFTDFSADSQGTSTTETSETETVPEQTKASEQ